MSAIWSRKFHGTARKEIWPALLGAGLTVAIVTRYIIRAQERLHRQRTGELKEMKPLTHIAGVDLGCRTMCIGIASIDSSQMPKVVEGADGLRMHPASVSIRHDITSIGGLAQKQALMYPASVANATQLLLGKTESSQIQEYIDQLPYSHMKNETGDNVISMDGHSYTPQYFMELMLEYLNDIAARNVQHLSQLGSMIAVSPMLNQVQRQLTVEACTASGMNILGQIDEPIASVYAARLHQAIPKEDLKKGVNILVADIGGISTVLSLVAADEQHAELLATRFTFKCSGDLIDKSLVHDIATNFREKEHIDLTVDPIAMSRIYEAAINTKMELSNRTTTDLNLPFITADQKGPKHLLQTVTRARMEKIIDPHLIHVINEAREMVAAAPKIDGILFVGGSNRTKYIGMEIAKQLKLPVYSAPSLHPEETVAIGACEAGRQLVSE